MQLPFPRLLEAMDRIAADVDEHVLAQIGPVAARYHNMTTCQTIPPVDYEKTFADARVVVAHAGIGTILTAKKTGKPLIVFPRRLDHGEHRNDHQLATAEKFEKLPGIHVAWTEADLRRLLNCPKLCGAVNSPSPSYATLLHRIEAFIDETPS